MNKEKQRIAIAEFCGLHIAYTSDPWEGDCDKCKKKLCDDIHMIPDYLEDLNAMHDVERVLMDIRPYDWMKYCRNVCSYYEPDCIAIQATAAQRAEALLRTIGKWKED